MPSQKILCPNCRTEISIDDVLTHQIEADIRKNFELEQQKKEAELRTKEAAVQKAKQEMLAAQAKLQETVAQKVTSQLAAEKAKMRTELRTDLKAELAKESETELKFLAEQLAEKEKKLDEARKQELEMRRQKAQLEEAKKAFELEKERQLEEERKKILEEASKKAEEAQQLKILEFSKKLEDAQKVNAELTRKLQQGSQQTQGEVLELELEELLRREFPLDEIVPVAKGKNGADIMQTVHDKYNRVCGTIIWELKNTQSWKDEFITKLKEDQRQAKAEVAVIVSVTLPKDVKLFTQRDGVWVVSHQAVVGVAMALRSSLQQVTTVKLASVGKNEKMEVLYTYLTSVEFKQKVESIVEAFTAMRTDLEKEKTVFAKMWAKREKEINRVISNTAGMYGDLEGMMGKALPRIEQLELGDGVEDEDSVVGGAGGLDSTVGSTDGFKKIEEKGLF